MAKTWPWINLPLPKNLINHPTLGSTLLVARDTLRNSTVSPLPSLMVLVLGIPEFAPGLQKPHLQRLAEGGQLQLSSDAGMSTTDPPLDFWSGLHLRNFLCRCSRILGISCQLAELEHICHHGEPVCHGLSII